MSLSNEARPIVLRPSLSRAERKAKLTFEPSVLLLFQLREQYGYSGPVVERAVKRLGREAVEDEQKRLVERLQALHSLLGVPFPASLGKRQ